MMRKSSKRIAAACTAVILAAAVFEPYITVTAAGTDGTESDEEGDSSIYDDTDADTVDISQEYPDEYTTVTIGTEDEFLEFAQNCSSDSWSVDKEVYLTADLDFSDTEFVSVPVFCGIFDGQGYTISGVTMTGQVSETGVFGTIRNTGTVKNLNVEGAIEPSGYPDTIGGIAGYNYGTVSNCTFSGSIQADSQAGGIVGRNGENGLIMKCTAYGTINASSGCGGIAGYNEGTITSCRNSMDVNITYTDTAPTLDELNDSLDDILQSGDVINTGSLSSESDTGGIAGFSSGVITSCTNYGTVGYEHVGYNVGGIAGRSSGYLSSNKNYGVVYGRKDVGGIVGQMQPYIELSFSEDVVENLESEFDTLTDMLDSAVSDAGSYSSAINSYLSELSDLASDAGDSLEGIADEAESSLESVQEGLNEMQSRIVDALDVISDSSGKLESGMAELEEVLSSITDGDLKEYLSALTDPLESLIEEMGSILSDSDSYADIDDLLSQLEELEDLAESYAATGDAESTDGEDASEDYEKVRGVLESLTDIVSSVKDALSDTADITSSVDISTYSSGGAISSYGDSLNDTLGGMADYIDALEDELSAMGSDAENDIEAIIDQFSVIGDAITEAIESTAENLSDNETSVEDISEEDVENTYIGRTTDCVNYGQVNADINTGGIVGMADLEYSLNPEQDVEISGNTTLDYVFMEKCIVDGCTNYGEIVTKSSYTGGIAGHMELGLAADCQNYGTLNCSGKYVGGIVGYSAGTVRDCASKCEISGSSYVGGIAGYGTVLYRNIAMLEISDCDQYAGAIAGAADNVDPEIIYDNFYYSISVYGINGVSYSGIAEGVSYSALLELEGIPDSFEDLVLSFYADDVLIDVITCGYGEDVDADELPAIPEKEGFYGTWSRTDYSGITTDESVEAVYYRYETLLISEQTRESGLPVLEVDGGFEKGDSITVTSAEAQDGEVERWTVVIPDDASDVHQIRFLIPEDVAGGTVYIEQDGQKVLAETEDFGEYVVFEAEGSEITVILEDTMTDSEYGKIKAAAFIVGCLCAVLIVLMLIIKAAMRKISVKKS